MNKNTLYLHIGWSKTGTSAIQYQLDSQFSELKNNGVLYSKCMQMNDNAHHNFALSFTGIHAYQSTYSVDDVLTLLDVEMQENQCGSLIISSELSPFYFGNKKFEKWVSRFDEVKLIVTVRRQSELLMSLFNQLVKDPLVRYPGSFFELAIANFPKVNYFEQLKKWVDVLGYENIVVIPYGKDIVAKFLNYFDLSLVSENAEIIVNPSLPNSALRLLQQQAIGVEDPVVYREIRGDILNSLLSCDEKPAKLLVTSGELRAIDNHFKYSNDLLAKKFLCKDVLFESKEYRDIFTY